MKKEELDIEENAEKIAELVKEGTYREYEKSQALGLVVRIERDNIIYNVFPDGTEKEVGRTEKEIFYKESKLKLK